MLVVPGPPLVVTRISAKTESRKMVSISLQFDVGTASAGGVVAIILANIVAIFLIRMIGKNLET